MDKICPLFNPEIPFWHALAYIVMFGAQAPSEVASMKKRIPLFAMSLVALASCSIPSISVASSEQAPSAPTSSEVPSSISEATSSSETPVVSNSEAEPSSEQVASSSEQPTVSSDQPAESSDEPQNLGYGKFETKDTRYAEYPSHNVFSDSAVLDTIGDKELLVIPVYTSDSSGFSKADLELVEDAYNAESKDTGWRSLRTYYEESSYGKLRMHATLLSPYALKKTTKQAASSLGASEAAMGKILNDIVQSYASTINLKDFDSNGDGHVDAVEFVYKNDGTEWDGDQESSTSVWWAYTSITGVSASKSAPTCGAYFWSAYNMIQTGYYTPNIDVHTLAHETGHLLGADDYYSYESDTDGSPAGMADMMDFNVGDHNAVTKSMYGWVDPYVPDGSRDEFEITLNSFEATGDCLMLVDPETWNGTQYDEYFMVSYYTPDGLNAKDISGYPEWGDSDYNYGKIYQKPGLQMFHADFRVGTYSERTGKATYAKDPLSQSAYVLASNTASYSNSGFRLLEAVPADGTNYFIGRNCQYRKFGSQKVLFGTSAYGGGSTSFTATTAKNILSKKTTLNNGNPIPWSFTITNQTNSSITLKLTKN